MIDDFLLGGHTFVDPHDLFRFVSYHSYAHPTMLTHILFHCYFNAAGAFLGLAMYSVPSIISLKTPEMSLMAFLVSLFWKKFIH